MDIDESQSIAYLQKLKEEYLPFVQNRDVQNVLFKFNRNRFESIFNTARDVFNTNDELDMGGLSICEDLLEEAKKVYTKLIQNADLEISLISNEDENEKVPATNVTNISIPCIMNDPQNIPQPQTPQCLFVPVYVPYLVPSIGATELPQSQFLSHPPFPINDVLPGRMQNYNPVQNYHQNEEENQVPGPNFTYFSPPKNVTRHSNSKSLSKNQKFLNRQTPGPSRTEIYLHQNSKRLNNQNIQNNAEPETYREYRERKRIQMLVDQKRREQIANYNRRDLQDENRQSLESIVQPDSVPNITIQENVTPKGNKTLGESVTKFWKLGRPTSNLKNFKIPKKVAFAEVLVTDKSENPKIKPKRKCDNSMEGKKPKRQKIVDGILKANKKQKSATVSQNNLEPRSSIENIEDFFSNVTIKEEPICDNELSASCGPKNNTKSLTQNEIIVKIKEEPSEDLSQTIESIVIKEEMMDIEDEKIVSTEKNDLIIANVLESYDDQNILSSIVKVEPSLHLMDHTIKGNIQTDCTIESSKIEPIETPNEPVSNEENFVALNDEICREDEEIVPYFPRLKWNFRDLGKKM